MQILCRTALVKSLCLAMIFCLPFQQITFADPQSLLLSEPQAPGATVVLTNNPTDTDAAETPVDSQPSTNFLQDTSPLSAVTAELTAQDQSATDVTLEAETMTASGWTWDGGTFVTMWADGKASADYTLSESGIYEVEIIANADDKGNAELPELRLSVDGDMIQAPVDVINNNWQFKSYKLTGIELTAGQHGFEVGAYRTAEGQYIALDQIVIRKTGEIPYPAARIQTEAEAMTASGWTWDGGTFVTMWADGKVSADYTISESGIYEVEIIANADDKGNGMPPALQLSVDGDMVGGWVEVRNSNWQFKSYHVSGIELTAGQHGFEIGAYQTELGQYIALDRIVIRKVGEIPYPSARIQTEAETMTPSGATWNGGNFVTMWGDGKVSMNYDISESGIYEVEIMAGANDTGDPLSRMMQLSIDGDMVSYPRYANNNHWRFGSYHLSGIELMAGQHVFEIGVYQTAEGQYISLDRIVIRKTGEIPYPAARIQTEAEAMTASGWTWDGGTFVTMWADGKVSADYTFSESGIYEVEIIANADDKGNAELPEVRLSVDGDMVQGPVEVKNSNWQFTSYKLTGIELTAGQHGFEVGAYRTAEGQYIALDKIVIRKTGEIPYLAARIQTEAEAMTASGWTWDGGTFVTMWGDGTLSQNQDIAESGIYQFKVAAFAELAGQASKPSLKLIVDGTVALDPVTIDNHNYSFLLYNENGLELSAGTHTFQLAIDSALEGQYISVDRFVIRKISPPNGLIIQGGAQYTNSRVLDMDLSTLASHYGVPQLVKYYSGTYVSDWEPFSVHRVLTVEDDGYKAINVYAKFSDISYKMFGSSIIVDTVPPNIAFDPLTTPTVLNKKTLTVNYAVDYTHYREEGTYLHWETKQITFTNLMEGENTLTITETDPAGNQTTVTRKVIVDTSLPDYTWIGGSSENHAWSTQANWINGIIPGAADTVTFYADSADCVIDAAVTLANMTMMAGYNGVITQQADVNISGNYSQAGGQWVDANPTTHAFNVGNSFSIPSAAGAFNRYGDQVFGYYLVRDVYDFQAMSGFLSSNFRLVNHVDASKTVNWNSGAGFDSIGNYDASHPEYAFSGTFDGNGLTINGLTVNRATESYSGLFGRTTNATLRNIGLVGGSITGRNLVGAIAGYMKSSSLENSYSTAAVIGDGQSDSIGGLVGYANASAVTNSYATGNVSNGGMFIGGLVGEIYVSSITNSYATGNVSPGVIGLHMGGLVGGNVYSSITNSFATGNVIGSGGGLVGTNYESSSITNSYATGNVTGWGGGLVGDNYASSFIANSFATGSVSDGGGLIGGDNGGTVSNSYFTDASHNNGLGTYESGGISAFYSVTHPVYNVSGLNPWDFTTVWDSSSNALPLLYQNLQFLYKWDIPQNGQVTESIYTVKNAATILIAKTVYLNGSEMDPSNNKDHWPILSQYTYYSSGNLKSWHESWSSTTYTYENQDYFHMRQGGVGYGVGRVIRIAEQMQNGDTYLRTAEYFSDKLNISRQKKEILRNGQAIPQEDESYYDEDLYPNPAVNVDAAGNKYVSALIPDGAGNWKVRLIQYNAQGVYQWGVNVDASFSGSSAVNAVDPEGNVYLAVTQWGQSDFNVAVYKYNANGMLQTGSPFVYASAGQSDRPVDMMVDASGLIYLSGESGYGSEQGLFVLQLNSDLTQSWVRTYKSTDGDGDHAGLLTSVPGGGVVLHGANHNGSGLEYYLVNYSADGTQLFVAADSDEYCFWDPSWWISGRWYKKTDTPPTTWYALGFLAGTSVSLVERTEGDYSFFPESFGDMTAYYFYDPTAHETTGAYVTLDNGLKGEAVFSGGDPDNVQLTKVIDPDGNTYWLLWGTNVYVGHDDVVIEKTAANEWTAYTFDRTATTIDELSQSMSLIGPVANPESLVLPGLGDWQTYCDAHGITVEYPSPSA